MQCVDRGAHLLVQMPSGQGDLPPDSVERLVEPNQGLQRKAPEATGVSFRTSRPLFLPPPFELITALGVAMELGRVQLFAINALALGGIGVLAARRLGAGRPLRRSRAVLVDAFAFPLVIIAVLFLTAAFQGPLIVAAAPRVGGRAVCPILAAPAARRNRRTFLPVDAQRRYSRPEAWAPRSLSGGMAGSCPRRAG